MAHIIAQSPSGPRAAGRNGADSYANLILLCPTCHRKVDKAPKGEYPEAMLHEWKAQHEAAVRRVGADKTFTSLSELKGTISQLLVENHHVWKELGPKSEVAQRDPSSNMHLVWNFRKLSTVIPNNQKIINIIEANIKLLSEAEHKEFLKFKNHAVAFEKHQYHRLDTYPTFPQSFSEAFKA